MRGECRRAAREEPPAFLLPAAVSDRYAFVGERLGAGKLGDPAHSLSENTAAANIVYRRKAHAHMMRHIAAYHGMTVSDTRRCKVERLIKAVSAVHSVLAEAREIFERRSACALHDEIR